MKFLIFLTIVWLLFSSFAKPSYAHFLETDGTIGAVLHVDPEDDPPYGSPSSFYFEFKDTTHRFTAEQCTCYVTILESGRQIYTQQLFSQGNQPSFDSEAFSYTFPQKDVYTVQVTGKPLQTNAFQPFTLSWNFRVTREVAVSSQARGFFRTHLILILGILAMIVFLLVLVLQQLMPRKPIQRR